MERKTRLRKVRKLVNSVTQLSVDIALKEKNSSSS